MNRNRHDQAQLCALFSAASNAMHASCDIPEILRIATQAATRLLAGGQSAIGLHIDKQMAFSEYFDGETWQPLDGRHGQETDWVEDLVEGRSPLLISSDQSPDTRFVDDLAPQLADADSWVALPLIGNDALLLGTLLYFDADAAILDSQAIEQLTHLASMTAVAIESAIRLSERRRIEDDLEKSVATYRTLVEQIPAITYIATLDRSRILFVSPQVEHILGYHQDEFLANQQIWSQRIHPDDRDRVLAEVRQSIEEKIPFHSEYRIVAKHGHDVWVKDAATIVREHDHDIYLQGVVHDISDRKEAEHKLVQMAHFDQLTGLANRVLFHDRLDQSLAKARRNGQMFAVLYLDLDGFKEVNDTLGHEMGDRLLAEAAHRLRENVREVDTVARMGGDEFTIILSDIQCRDSVAMVANKLVTAISQPYEGIGEEHQVTLSMGVAIYPDDSNQRDALVTAADNAMYRAKNSGKNCFCFHVSE